MELPKNLTDAFFDYASQHPHKVALVEPLKWSEERVTEEKVWTFSQFAQVIRLYQSRFDTEGFRCGDRILILLPVSVRMYALIAACLANGLTPVFIDATLPRDQFLHALKTVRPTGVFSTLDFLKYRFVLRSLWRCRLYAFDHRGVFLRDWERVRGRDLISRIEGMTTARNASDETLITFTSGSTGRPKAADRSFDIVYHQRELSRALWTEGENDRELTAFPLVVLNNLAAGVTTVLPAVNFSRLDHFSVRCWAQQIETHRVNRLIAAPSILEKLTSGGGFERREAFRSITNLVTGGAAIPNWLVRRAKNLLPECESFVVYGSTEAEPMAFASFDEILDSNGPGYLVGKTIREVGLRLVTPLETVPLRGDFRPVNVTSGIRGESVVSGPHVVRRYLYNDEENRKTKLVDIDGAVWHRTGDSGEWDQSQRLWLTGRLRDRVDGVDPYPLEHRLENRLETRVAFIEMRDGHPCIFIQSGGAGNVELALQEEGYSGEWRILPTLPVDRRHFWKMDREKLRSLNSVPAK